METGPFPTIMQSWSKFIEKFYEFFFLNMWIEKMHFSKYVLGMHFGNVFHFFPCFVYPNTNKQQFFFMSTKNKGRGNIKKGNNRNHTDIYTHTMHLLTFNYYFRSLSRIGKKSFWYLSTSTITMTIMKKCFFFWFSTIQLLIQL